MRRIHAVLWVWICAVVVAGVFVGVGARAQGPSVTASDQVREKYEAAAGRSANSQVALLEQVTPALLVQADSLTRWTYSMSYMQALFYSKDARVASKSAEVTTWLDGEQAAGRMPYKAWVARSELVADNAWNYIQTVQPDAERGAASLALYAALLQKVSSVDVPVGSEVDRDRSRGRCYVRMTKAHRKLGDPVSAQALADGVVANAPTNPIAHYTVMNHAGLAWEDAGDDTKAVLAFEQAFVVLAQDPFGKGASSGWRNAVQAEIGHMLVVMDRAGKTQMDRVPYVAALLTSEELGATTTFSRRVIRMMLPAKSTLQLALGSALDTVKTVRADQIATTGGVDNSALRILAIQLSEGGVERPLSVGAFETAVAAAIDTTTAKGAYWQAMFAGDYAGAIRTAYAQTLIPEKFGQWAEFGVAPAIRCLDQCSNGRALEYFDWATGEAVPNPIAAIVSP